MLGYIPSVLQEYQHKPPSSTQDNPYKWNKPVYGKHIQLATQQISAPKLNSTDTNRAKSINVTFFYYARVVYPTVIPYTNKISTYQSAPTQDTLEKCNQLLDYASTHMNATI